MASSADSTDRDTETEGDEDSSSRFVVGSDQLRDGDFETLDDARTALEADDE